MFDQQHQSLQAWADATVQEWRKQGFDRDMRIATWVLVGNGAALLLCFNAVISGSISDWSPMKPFAMVFLLGMVCAFASVVFEGELVNRATARLIKMSGASRQAATCIEANIAYREHLLKAPEPDPAIEQQLSENNGVIEDVRKQLGELAKESIFDKLLHRAGRIALVLGAAALGSSLFLAINGDVIQVVTRR